MSNIDYARFIPDNFDIIEKASLEVVPFSLFEAQIKYLENMSNRDIILKPRQLGFSSVVEAVFTVDFLTRPNSRGVIISHEADATQRLLDKVKFFLESFTRRHGKILNLKYNSKSELVNADINSVLYVGTAGSRTFGRGDTIHNCHLSEFAFYGNPSQIFSGISQAVPANGRIIIESTANGMGNPLHKLWVDAKNGRSVFKPHFFSWFIHKEYQKPVPDGFTMDAEEQEHQVRYALSKEQISWRRDKIRELDAGAGNGEDIFKQEYPATDHEAFLSSGRSVFSNATLDWYSTRTARDPIAVGNLVGYKPIAFDSNERGYVKVYAFPRNGSQYIIGADVAEVNDFSCAQVLDRSTLEQVAVWHGRCDADVFGRELYRLGMYYNGATLAVERNNQGLATLYSLRDLNYPTLWFREKVGKVTEEQTLELGWLTDVKSKDLMISDTREVIRSKSLILNDRDTIRELMAYSYRSHGSKDRWIAGAEEGEHDDRVVALMIAVQMYNRVPLEVKESNLITDVEDTAPYKVTRDPTQNMIGRNDIMQPGFGPEEYM